MLPAAASVHPGGKSSTRPSSHIQPPSRPRPHGMGVHAPEAPCAISPLSVCVASLLPDAPPLQPDICYTYGAWKGGQTHLKLVIAMIEAARAAGGARLLRHRPLRAGQRPVRRSTDVLPAAVQPLVLIQ